MITASRSEWIASFTGLEPGQFRSRYHRQHPLPGPRSRARYLGWLAAKGHIATIHPWIAIVAADLARRVRWRRCALPHGAGRLLWMCEHMAGPTKTNDLVPQLWNAATSRGITAPDLPHATANSPPPGYTALLRERTTGAQLTITDGHVHATNAITGTSTTWTGTPPTPSPSPAGSPTTTQQPKPPAHSTTSTTGRHRRQPKEPLVNRVRYYQYLSTAKINHLHSQLAPPSAMTKEYGIDLKVFTFASRPTGTEPNVHQKLEVVEDRIQ